MNYKIIKLNLTKVAKVSLEDYDELIKHKWSAVWIGDRYYARAKIDDKYVYMHRFIMKPKRNKVVDHLNNKGLDNRRENLRIASHRQNRWNQANMYGRKPAHRSLRDFVCNVKYRNKEKRITYRECQNRINLSSDQQYYELHINDNVVKFSIIDLDIVLAHTWHMCCGYAKCSDGMMHRMIGIRQYGKLQRTTYIDHQNRIKSDNRRKNLRLANHLQNSKNRMSKRGDMRSIRVLKTGFSVYITHNGKNEHVGTFATLIDAKKARLEFEKKNYNEFRVKRSYTT